MRQPDWLEDPDPDDPPRRSRPRWLLLVAAGLPWALIIGLLLVSGHTGQQPDPTGGGAVAADGTAHPDVGYLPEAGGEASPTAPPTDPTPHDPRTSTSQPKAVAPSPPSAPATSSEGPQGTLVAELRGRWRVDAGLEEAASLAVVVARAWLTGFDPVLTIDELGPAREGANYAEHLVVEAVEQPAPGAAVVTILAVVLDGDDQDLEAAVRRLAVPIVMATDGPRSAGRPWDLPPPKLDPVDLEPTPVQDPDLLLAAAEALDAAGLTGHTLLALDRTEHWPVLATVSGPEEDDSTVVWLREHVGGFVVAGTTLAGHRGAADATSGATGSAPTGEHPESDHAPGEGD